MPTTNPWRWIPSLYFSQGLPYVVAMTLSVVMYKNLGLSNTDIALYTSWLYLPWVIKPLWGPMVDLLGRKRVWVVAMQWAMAISFAALAITLPAGKFVQMSLAVLWLMAFASATHDMAADGFYMLALRQDQQAAFVGVRSAAYRLAMIGGQGGLVYLAGWLTERSGQPLQAWAWVFWVLAFWFALAGLLHSVLLPRPGADQPAPRNAAFWQEWLEVFRAFFRKPGLRAALAFLLLHRFAEAQALKLLTPFMLDPQAQGGLGLKTQDVGLAYGTVGVISLTLGGLLGGWAISQYGLKRMLWPMVLAMHVTNLLFVALAALQPSSLWWVSTAVAAEQAGYGFGFAAYLVFMLMLAGGLDGQATHKTAHYALCTGFMALGMMLPGMWAGWLQAQLGYLNFFIVVCLATVPSFIAASHLRIDANFGRKPSE